jgi:HEAT repeat protein
MVCCASERPDFQGANKLSAKPEPPMTHETIRGLVSRDDDEVLDALRKLSANSDQFLRRTALEIIGKHRRGRELAASVLEAFRDPSDYVRRTACEVVGQWKLVEAHDLMLPLLREPAASTRESVLRALAAIWAGADFQPVFEIYKNDPEIGVRREAAWTLRHHAHKDNWRVLFDAFCADELTRHRLWACELAGTFGDSEILPALSSLADDSDGHVRKATARASHMVVSRS